VGLSNEVVLTVALGALALYFTVLVVRVLQILVLFRRMKDTAVLTWTTPRPWIQSPLFALALGLLAAGLTIMLATLGRPFHHVYSQAVMALYFLFLAPVVRRIPLGVYRDGVWADSGFLPWAKVARLAFRETPEIVLVLLRRGGGAFRLPVPPGEYGAVRKLLDEKMRAHVLEVDTPILGLSGAGH
jgi:hypothetical protein